MSHAIPKIVAVAGLAVLLSTSAEAGLRFGPGAVLGLVGLPLHMMTHGIGVPLSRRHAAPGQSAAPAARAAPNPPIAPPVVQARADPSHPIEPTRPAPPTVWGRMVTAIS
jgi:hypothetical protein